MMNRIKSKYIHTSFNQEGYTVLSIKRSNGRCIIEYICTEKHIHSIRWDHWKTGQRCAHCFGNTKNDISMIRKEFEIEGYVLLTKVYRNSRHKLDYICPDGHIHSVRLDSWRVGLRCPYCNGWKLSYKFVKSEFEKEGYVLISKKYEGPYKKLFYTCSNGHNGNIPWNRWKLGQRCLVCSNISVSVRQTGCGNSNWKEGTSHEPYCEIWTDKEYKQSILERDNLRCQNPYCFRKAKRLLVHHIDYNKKHCHPWNLITLCNSCNSMANGDRDWHTDWYQIIMNRKHGYNYE